jgi:hypothetical protein
MLKFSRFHRFILILKLLFLLFIEYMKKTLYLKKLENRHTFCYSETLEAIHQQ